MPAREAIRKTHRILKEMGGEWDEETSLFFDTPPEGTPESVPVTNEEEALDKLTTVPGLVAVDYVMPEGTADVYYEKSPGGDSVQAVVITIGRNMFDRGGAETIKRYADIAARLHEELGAARTVMGWGLRYQGFRWSEELERLERGQYVNSYEIADLRGGGR
jgi:hypothetical protein